MLVATEADTMKHSPILSFFLAPSLLLVVADPAYSRQPVVKLDNNGYAQQPKKGGIHAH
jgi:hypothetical protein